MKAFLLAAGKGTRLRPLTLDTPKCLIPICGRPLIEYWFDIFKNNGISEVLINTSYLADKVKDYVRKNSRGIKIRLAHEDDLLGSGGTIKKNWDFVKDEKSFFICYADNLTDIDLKEMKQFYEKKKRDFALALFKVLNPKECGIVEIDEDASIVSFIEKPENPVSDLAFAGIIISNSRLKDYFPDKDVFDLGYEVLPKLISSASGYVMRDYLLDIGTPEKLYQAEDDVRRLLVAGKAVKD